MSQQQTNCNSRYSHPYMCCVVYVHVTDFREPAPLPRKGERAGSRTTLHTLSKSTSLQPHTTSHLNMTLPHSTVGSEVPLRLAEVLGEASQLLGLRSAPPRVPVWLPKWELERKLKWRNTAMELFTSWLFVDELFYLLLGSKQSQAPHTVASPKDRRAQWVGNARTWNETF